MSMGIGRWRAALAAAGIALAGAALGDVDGVKLGGDGGGRNAGAAPAAAAGRWSVNAQAWGYATRQSVADDSVLNPANRIAAEAADLVTADLRFDAKYATDALDLVARPRILLQDARGDVPGATTRDDYLSQGYLRWRPLQSVAVTLGRDGIDWGPANFRSPSNPFYFDAGRTNPLRDVSGLDLARVSAVSGANGANGANGTDVLTAAYVVRSGHDAPGNPYRDTAVFKVDHRAQDSVVSLVVAPQHHGTIFLGGYGQVTIGEPWLVYVEAGSQRLPVMLQAAADADSSSPYELSAPSSRAATTLAGAAYTLQSGQTLTGELLHDGHGFGRPAERAYFDRAAEFDQVPGRMATAALGAALGDAPRLLARDYLYLLWQSNPNLASVYWRAGYTANLDDHSGQLSLYGEYNVAARVTLFGALAIDHGTRRTEFASLLRGTLTLGAKLFVL